MKFFILQLAFIGAQVAETALQFGKEGGTASINVRTGSEFVLSMVTNPTTGYNWRLTGPLPHCIYESSEKVIKSESGLMGSPSILRIVYGTKGECAGEIEYSYSRPWEKAPPGDVPYVRVHVSVSDGIEL